VSAHDLREVHAFGPPVSDGAGLTFVRRVATDRFQWGVMTVATGDEVVAGEAELGKFASPRPLAGPGPTLFLMAGTIDWTIWALDPQGGPHTALADFGDNDGHWGLLALADGQLLAAVAGSVVRVPTAGGARATLASLLPGTNLQTAASADGRWVLQATPERVERLDTRTGDSAALDYVEGQPWYQEQGPCQHQLAPIVLSPRGDTFVLTTLGGTLGSGCPEVEGHTPPPAPKLAWLVRLQDLSVEPISAMGTGGPAISPSGAGLPYVGALESGGCPQLIVRDTATGTESPAAEGKCTFWPPHWVVVPE
jgi:hypothetical protein